MSLNPILGAQSLLATWRATLGSDLPKPLIDSEAALDAVSWAQPTVVPVDPTKVTAKNAEAVVLDLATALASEATFKAARSQVQTAVARHVLVAALDVLPSVLSSLEPRLKAAAAAFADGLESLPDDPTPEVLINAGGSTVEAFQTAKAAEAELDVLDRFAGSLSELYGFHAEPCLRILTVTTRAGMSSLLNAYDRKGVLKQLWVEAVNNEDVTFTLNTPEQSKEIRAVVDALPVERKPVMFASVN